MNDAVPVSPPPSLRLATPDSAAQYRKSKPMLSSAAGGARPDRAAANLFGPDSPQPDRPNAGHLFAAADVLCSLGALAGAASAVEQADGDYPANDSDDGSSSEFNSEPRSTSRRPKRRVPATHTYAMEPPASKAARRKSRGGGGRRHVTPGDTGGAVGPAAPAAFPADDQPRKFSSSYFGVSWHKSSQRWAVQIRHDGKRIHVGYYAKEIDAAKAYDQVAKKLRGHQTRTNFTEDGVLIPYFPKTAASATRAPRGGPKSPAGVRASAAAPASMSKRRGGHSNVPAASPGMHTGSRRGNDRSGRGATKLAMALAEASPATPASSASFAADPTEFSLTEPPAVPRVKIPLGAQQLLDAYFHHSRVVHYTAYLQEPLHKRGISILRRPRTTATR